MCACLGGAYRAIHALQATTASFSEAVKGAADGEDEDGKGKWLPHKDAISVSSIIVFAAAERDPYQLGWLVALFITSSLRQLRKHVFHEALCGTLQTYYRA
jgi:hypothetical protein